MTIGEKIIAAIDENRLVHDATDYIHDAVPEYKNRWHENSQYLLDALVAAHVEEQVRLRLEAYRKHISDDPYFYVRVEKPTQSILPTD